MFEIETESCEEINVSGKQVSPLRAVPRTTVALMTIVALVAVALPAAANSNSTVVPGQQGRYDTDNNDYPDDGAVVTGKYESVYAYDADGDWYWDLGDGRIQGTVDTMDDLDQATLTVCDYQVQYRGSFDNDPFLDKGWIKNNINCSGYDDNGTYNYVIVHETDPRYTGDPDRAVWGTWEYHVYTTSGQGNLVMPSHGGA